MYPTVIVNADAYDEFGHDELDASLTVSKKEIVRNGIIHVKSKMSVIR